MVKTRSSIAKTEADGTNTTSKGLQTLSTRTKLDNTIKRFDKEFKLCKTSLVQNWKLQDIVDNRVRWAIMDRERTIQRLEKLFEEKHLQLEQLFRMRDSVWINLYDSLMEPIPDLEGILDLLEEIADLTTKIDQILLFETEIERNIRKVKTKFTIVEMYLQMDKADHENIHLCLSQKLAVIARSRHRAIAQRKGLDTTKNRRKI